MAYSVTNSNSTASPFLASQVLAQIQSMSPQQLDAFRVYYSYQAALQNKTAYKQPVATSKDSPVKVGLKIGAAIGIVSGVVSGLLNGKILGALVGGALFGDINAGLGALIGWVYEKFATRQ